MTEYGRDAYCCCQMILINHGIYLIALHCLLQAASGVGIVTTSAHKSQNNAVNYTTIASNLCLIPTGILVFWASLYQSWKGARAAFFFTVAVSLFNFVMAITYFATYVNFKANSLLDQDLFWKNKSDWVGSGDFPFTIWHILGFYLIFINLLWFYYSIVICKFSRILKSKKV